MRISFIIPDKTAVIDGYVFENVDFSILPPAVRALQWFGSWGEVEFYPNEDGSAVANEVIDGLGGLTALIDELLIRKAEETKPPPPPTDEHVAQGARIYRDLLLEQCDYTQTLDYQELLTDEERAAWRTYRQKLRDVTKQPGFPHNVVFPISPDPKAPFDPERTHAA